MQKSWMVMVVLFSLVIAACAGDDATPNNEDGDVVDTVDVDDSPDPDVECVKDSDCLVGYQCLFGKCIAQSVDGDETEVADEEEPPVDGDDESDPEPEVDEQEAESCFNGQQQCQDNAVMYCNQGTWEVQQDCGDEELCVPNADAAACYPLVCEANSAICADDGQSITICNENGTQFTTETCAECTDGNCVPRVCNEGDTRCVSGNTGVMESCNESGTEWVQTPCQSNEICSYGECLTKCELAEKSNSYMGCNFWPTVTMNSGLDEGFSGEFGFAAVVGNTNDEVAHVTVIDHSNGQSTQVNVQANAVETISLAWKENLLRPILPDESDFYSVFTSDTYELLSDIPVSVYQFTPLFSALPATTTACFALGETIPSHLMCDWQNGQRCNDETSGFCQDFSFTNDASILLPTHSLADDYIILTRPTFHLCGNYDGSDCSQPATNPAFFSIVAVEEGQTSVEVTFTADTLAGLDNNPQAFTAGQTTTFMMEQNQVIQFLSGNKLDQCQWEADTDPNSTRAYCEAPAGTDFTGTRVRSNGKRVAVFTGHDCDFVPYNRWACDHLEQQVPPVRTWGNRFLVTYATQELTNPNVVKIVSSADGNTLTFTPEVHAEVTLNAGEFIEFEFAEHFRVVSTHSILVGQFLVGQNYQPDAATTYGDPAFFYNVPYGQFLSEYSFLAPSTYKLDYLNIIAPEAANIFLDGWLQDDGWTTITDTGLKVKTMEIFDGVHKITSDDPQNVTFGIVVYGMDEFVSYAYPGGMKLEDLITSK